MIRKDKSLIFEMSQPGRMACSLPDCDVPDVEITDFIPIHLLRETDTELPEVSEVDVIRHFTQLSQRNHGVDSGGGGVIGIEFAGIFNALGSQVTVIEFLPRILANMDGEISKRIALSLKKKGINIENETRVKQIMKCENGFEILAEGKKGENLIQTEVVLVSTGRIANVDGLNLDLLGIEYDRKGIKVDESYRTNIPGIYAIGDVIGGQMLAHVASEEGKAAVENIMGLKGHMNYDTVPGCVFTFPEVAAVGLSEEDAKGKGINFRSSKFMFGANGKALTMREEEGFVKVMAETQTGKIVGVHIMGPHASDLIHEAVLAVGNKMTSDDISRIVHAHPTLSEAFMEAALGIENKAIHMPPQKSKQLG